jgi:glutathione S-transferase
MHELILHHYDFSPFSEKIRLIFGLKALAWRSVTIPSVMPKPDLIALTGGYRHTPVLQIGADIFCDTRLIARELERRHPQPLLVDERHLGVALAIEAWAERDLFWPVVRYVSGINAEQVAPDLHADRAAMRGKHPPSIARLRAFAEANLSLVEAQLARVEIMVRNGRPYLLGNAPGLADLAVYHALWFFAAMPIDCSAVLKSCPATRAWMKRMAAIGHGVSADMSSREAIEIARHATPAAPRPSEPATFDPPRGTPIAVRPEEYKTEEVVGDLILADADEVALRRTGPEVDEVVVHFPRVGYAMRTL